jgi:HAD superfamily hydrolase (TIGR01549 family)
VGVLGVTKIRAVLFDVDGTLYHQWPVRVCTTLEMAAHFAMRRAPLELSRNAKTLLTFRSVQEGLRPLGHSTVPLMQLQFEETARRVNTTPDEVRRLVDEWMFRRPTKYLHRARRREVVAAVDMLARQKIHLGVLSDYPVDGKLDALGLSHAFPLRLCTTNADINAFKPHPRGLLRACERWGLRPAEVVYVGDRADVDAAAAAAAGMRCYLVGPARSADRLNPTHLNEDEPYGSRRLDQLHRDCRAAA